MAKTRLFYATAFIVLAAATGCEQDDRHDPRIQAARAKWLLRDEPANAVTLLDLRDNLDPQRDVVVVGMIGGAPQPWTKGRAAFVIGDPALLMEVADPDHECGPGCPHCAKKREERQAQGLAFVRFLDERGELISIDAQRLFGLQREQIVVVRGRAELDDLGNLVVSANGLYVRR